MGSLLQFLTPSEAEGLAAALHQAALQLQCRVCVALSLGARATFPGTAEGSLHVDMDLGTFARGAAPAATEAGEPLSYYLAQCCIASSSPSASAVHAPQLGALVEGALGADGWPPSAVDRAMAQCLGPGERRAFEQANLWWCDGSGGGHLTGTHFDASQNLLLVLRGAKRVLLLPPSAGPYLGEAPLSHPTPNHASAHLWQGGAALGEGQALPLLPSGLPPPLSQAAAAFTLLPGAALYIPEGWWHTVISAPGTLAVNFWYAGARAPASAAGAAAAAASPAYLRYTCRLALLELGKEERARMVAAHVQGALDSEVGRAVVAAAVAHGGGTRAGFAAALQALPATGRGGRDRECALCAASTLPGLAMEGLLALLDSGGAAAVGEVLKGLAPLTVEALQAAWEREEEEQQGAAAAARRSAGFQRLWGAAFGTGEAAAEWLAQGRQAVMATALHSAVNGLHI
jgi:hypothetical protein